MTQAIVDRANTISRPRCLPYIGVLPKMRRDKLGLLLELMHDYGDVVSMPLPGLNSVMITNPSLIGKILLETERTFCKSKFYNRLEVSFGQGLVTSSKEVWQKQHELAAPLFKARMLEGFVEQIISLTRMRVEKLALNNAPSVDITNEMMELTLQITLATLFSGEATNEISAIRENLHEIQQYSDMLFWALIPVPLWMPTPANLRFKRALKAMDAIIYRIINKRINSEHKPHDILTLFIGENLANVDVKQVRDEVITMMLAGHDTTAHALSYCLYLISNNANVCEKLDDEHKKVLNGEDPRWENIKDLNYTKMTFCEGLRLFPPAWAVSRFSPHPLEFEGYSFAANTTYFLPQYAMHRHPRYWPNPEQFIPERFTKEEIATRPKYAYFPFGGGPRVCIGQALATLEAQIILPMLLQRFTFAPDNQFALNARITLSPNPNIKLKKLHRLKFEQKAD